MDTRKLAPFVLLVSLLAVAGCAHATPAAVGPTHAPHPVIGFASPGNHGDAEPAPRFESDRMLPRPMVISESWAR